MTCEMGGTGCGLQAVLVVADADTSLTITGNGDVLEPYDGVIGERERKASSYGCPLVERRQPSDSARAHGRSMEEFCC